MCRVCLAACAEKKLQSRSRFDVFGAAAFQDREIDHAQTRSTFAHSPPSGLRGDRRRECRGQQDGMCSDITGSLGRDKPFISASSSFILVSKRAGISYTLVN